jgi:dihydropteroate synthase
VLQTGARTLTLERTRIMGVLNLTPDSFSDGGRFLSGRGGVDVGPVRREAEAMLRAGADVLDIGGESTRPGAAPVGESEELERVMPVLNSLLELDTIVSVDTRTPSVARAALAAGCHLINDVSGLTDDAMLQAVAESRAGVCIMHMQGQPGDMQVNPSYADVVAEVRQFLERQVERARSAGIEDARICLDPGFGFGKTLTHNLKLLRSLGDVRVDGLPLLVGLSRKRMIGALTGAEVDERMPGSVAAAVLAAERGANIVRVHDVAETAQALKILDAVRT